MPLKKKIIIALMLVGSGLFLYQGFSLLFHGDKEAEAIEKKSD